MSSKCSFRHTHEEPEDDRICITKHYEHRLIAGNARANEKKRNDSGHKFSTCLPETHTILTTGASNMSDMQMLAINVSWFHRLHWVMQTSLLRTLARKHRASLKAMSEKYRATTETPYGKLSCLEVVVERANGKKPLIAQFGGIPLRRQEKASLTDLDPTYSYQRGHDRNELIKRLLAEKCELGGSHTNIEVHHIRKLADLKEKGRKEKPRWAQKMAQRRRKTLIVCANCHESIHRGDGKPQRRKASLESGVR